MCVLLCSSFSRSRINLSIFSSNFPTATPATNTDKANPANVTYPSSYLFHPPFRSILFAFAQIQPLKFSEGLHIPPYLKKGQPPTVMVAHCLFRDFSTISNFFSLGNAFSNCFLSFTLLFIKILWIFYTLFMVPDTFYYLTVYKDESRKGWDEKKGNDCDYTAAFAALIGHTFKHIPQRIHLSSLITG